MYNIAFLYKSLHFTEAVRAGKSWAEVFQSWLWRFWARIPLETENSSLLITKTYLYNFDPLKPHFYIVKLGFTGVYIIFLISAQNIDCGTR